MSEENIQLPENGNKSETEKYIEDLIVSIESELPKNVNYTTGIIVDDERNLLIIKDGKLYIGRSEDSAKEIREYMKDANAGYLINALYILQRMLPSYKDLWSGKIEKEAKKTLNEII